MLIIFGPKSRVKNQREIRRDSDVYFLTLLLPTTITMRIKPTISMTVGLYKYPALSISIQY